MWLLKLADNYHSRNQHSLLVNLGFTEGPDGYVRTVWESRCYRILEVLSSSNQLSRLVLEYRDRDSFGKREWVNVAWLEGGNSPAVGQYQRVIQALLDELVKQGLLSPLFSASEEE